MATVHAVRSNPPARLTTPKNREGLEASLRLLGDNTRELAKLDRLVSEEIARVTALFAEARETLKKRIAKNADQIAKSAEKLRATLAPEGEKTVALESGKLVFYFGPSAVVCEDEEAVIAYLEEHGPAEALRVKTELNREFIDEHKDELDLDGVTHEQTEFIQIIPTGLEKGPTRKIRVVAVE